MPWYNDILGCPYEADDNPPHSFNCGNLIRWVYKTQLGIDSPELMLDCHDTKTHIRRIESYFKEFDRFVEIEGKPQEFDIARMYRVNRPWHIGVYCNGGILHTMVNVGVCWERLFNFKNRYKIKWVRHEQLL